MHDHGASWENLLQELREGYTLEVFSMKNCRADCALGGGLHDLAWSLCREGGIMATDIEGRWMM
jgi:hypothetical protein